MAMRPLLVIDNVPVSLFVQITMIEFSPLSCWIVGHFQVLTAVPFDQLIAQLLTLSLLFSQAAPEGCRPLRC